MKTVNKKQPFKYRTGKVPKSYKCSECKTTGVKLWREYNTFLDHQTLRCCTCAGEYGDVLDLVRENITAEGKIPWYYQGKFMQYTDQVGGLIPAVPTQENDTFWGYTSVPEDGCVWWKNLPNFTDPKENEIHNLRCLLREIDVEYVNKRIELPQHIHAKIVNLIGVK